MQDRSLVFVDVDTQRDFLDPAGALYVEGSDAILGNLARLTTFARAHGIRVLATACAHNPGDPELNVFPPHCLLGTPGQERIAETNWPDSLTVGPDDAWAGEIPAHLTLQKREYDCFSHASADAIVAAYERERPTFVVYGVATDYCVKAAVVGLLERGCRVAVVVDAVRPIDADAEGALFTDFVHQGARLVLAEVVCTPPSGR